MNENGKMNLVGGADAWAMSKGETLSDLERKAAIDMHNKAIDAHKAALDKKVQDELEKAKEITEKMDSMEIMPAGVYVLVRPYSSNPYEKIEVRDSGLFIPTFEGDFKNPDTGEDDKMENFSCQGTVIEVGPQVKYIKEGDDVFYRRAQAIPIPFFKMGMEVVPEQCIQCVINEGVKARWAELQK